MMAGFLTHLVERTLAVSPALTPRLRGPYEGLRDLAATPGDEPGAGPFDTGAPPRGEDGLHGVARDSMSMAREVFGSPSTQELPAARTRPVAARRAHEPDRSDRSDRSDQGSAIAAYDIPSVRPANPEPATAPSAGDSAMRSMPESRREQGVQQALVALRAKTSLDRIVGADPRDAPHRNSDTTDETAPLAGTSEQRGTPESRHGQVAQQASDTLRLKTASNRIDAADLRDAPHRHSNSLAEEPSPPVTESCRTFEVLREAASSIAGRPGLAVPSIDPSKADRARAEATGMLVEPLARPTTPGASLHSGPVQASLQPSVTPTVHVTIGRIELRAAPASASPSPSAQARLAGPRPALSLADYLARRGSGDGR